jgi:GNAT superfamily N-acetyltransferase
VAPLTEDRWDDFVDLFTRPGPRGGAGPGTSGCWCMWWRVRGRPAENRAGMEALARAGAEPGLVAYDAGRPVGWISVAPRESHAQLMRSRSYRPPDEDTAVWSITCIYVHPAERRRRIAAVLLERAVEHAFERGATAVEAYPATVEARSDYMGSLHAYRRLGFVPVREASTRTVVRLKHRRRRK